MTLQTRLRGTSGESLAKLREQADVPGRRGRLDTMSSDLLAVAALLTRESGLRGALTDPGSAPRARQGMAETLFGSRVGKDALPVVVEAVGLRWSRSADLGDALELMGASASFRAAEADGSLDAVEDELFRFGRLLIAEPTLRAFLQDVRVEPDRKAAVLRDLLAGKASPTTVTLLEHVVRDPRGRPLQDAVDDLVGLAAERTDQIVADVRVAIPLEPEQERRLEAALSRVYRRNVRVQASVEPDLLGGVVVMVGDEVIDGSVLARLEQARRRLAG